MKRVPTCLDYESPARAEHANSVDLSATDLVALLMAVLLVAVTVTHRHPDSHTLTMWFNIVGVILLFAMMHFSNSWQGRAVVFFAWLLGLMSLLMSTIVLGSV